LTRLYVEKLDAAEVLGLERPRPREMRERLFSELVEERYRGMTAVAAEVARRDLGLDPALL
jgi:hypothetical protein